MGKASMAAAPRPLPGGALLFMIFLPFAAGHFLSSLLRNINAVLAPSLQVAVALTPGEVGLLTSARLLAFGPAAGGTGAGPL